MHLRWQGHQVPGPGARWRGGRRWKDEAPWAGDEGLGHIWHRLFPRRCLGGWGFWHQHPSWWSERAQKKICEFPIVEGDESITEYIGQYKKSCLSKKALLKSTRERLERDNSKGHEILCLAWSRIYLFSTCLVASKFQSLMEYKPCFVCFHKEIRKDLESLEKSGSHLV